MSYILIVDDEPIMREVLKLMLHRLDMPIRTAANGIDALNIMQKEPPAIVLLDIMMPVMDGTEMFHFIRQNPVLRTIPVLFISALPRASVDIPELDTMPQCYAYVEKDDFSPTGLLSQISKLLNPTNVPMSYQTQHLAQ